MLGIQKMQGFTLCMRLSSIVQGFVLYSNCLKCVVKNSKSGESYGISQLSLLLF